MPYYDDDGNELNADLIRKPCLCVGCRIDEPGDEMEHILCNLTRLDQNGKDEIICFAFVPKSGSDNPGKEAT